MVEKDWPMQMIEWLEKLRWDRAGNVEKNTGNTWWKYLCIQCVPVPSASGAIWEYGRDLRAWELQEQREQKHSGYVEGHLII